jgi:hypothetical protein
VAAGTNNAADDGPNPLANFTADNLTDTPPV